MDKRLRDNILLSLFGSAIFGFMVYLIMSRVHGGWYWALVAGGGLAVVLIGYLVGYEYLVTRRYAKAAAGIQSKIHYFIVGNIRTEYGRRGGNIYYCDDRVVAICLDKRPHQTVTIMKCDIAKVEVPRLVQVCIHMNDGTEHMISSTDAPRLAADLTKKSGKKKG